MRRKTLIRQGRLAMLNDAIDTQIAQVELFADEVVDDVERVQNYGFTSYPEDGGVYIINVGGKGNQPVIIAVNDDKARLRIKPGEVAIYHSEGHHVILKGNGVIEANCTTLIANAEESATISTNDALVEAEAVMIDAPDTYMTGALTVDGPVSFGGGGKVDGRLDVTGEVTSEGVSLPKHDHGGVQPGGGNSGGPNK
ncbi:hypothetical protein DC081_09140 [Ignatzschineria cameli]|uniref:phage baseplate assembly protein V n=1 Tax=Ignatzschineria cameli TaxID=2182793 RepID=UPI000D6124DD|nr:phage baseplate assembly protein V [Ignatzschineria cameli]PWD89604.1 hypothetical protein DC081_09140 [Ignatzschineria cameli]